jgi:hypothetical protein
VYLKCNGRQWLLILRLGLMGQLLSYLDLFIGVWVVAGNFCADFDGAFLKSLGFFWVLGGSLGPPSRKSNLIKRIS